MEKKRKRYVLSKFAHVLEVDTKNGKESVYAIYHALNMEVIFTRKSLAEFFIRTDRDKRSRNRFLKKFTQLESSIDGPPMGINKNSWGSFLQILLSKKLVLEEGIEEGLFLEKFQNKKEFAPIVRIRLMYLMPTYDCNLACKYCSISSALKTIKSDNKGYKLTKDTAFRAINLFFELLHPFLKNYKIIFYGGEPLLNWSVIEASLEYISKKNHELSIRLGEQQQVKCALLTNGVLMNEQIVTVLKKHNCSVSISIDGPKNLHDQFRLCKKGQGSFHKSLKAFELLREAGIQPSISCSLPQPNVDAIESICYFFKDKLKIKTIGFNPIRNLPDGSPYLVPPEKTTVALLKAFKYFREAGIYEDRIMRKVKAFVQKKFYAQDCAAYGCQIAVGPSGEVGPCHILLPQKCQVIGSIYEPDIVEKIQKSPIMSAWARRKPLFMEACKDCICLGICGGGCAAESLRKSETIFSLDEDFCIHSRNVLEWMINDLYLKSKDFKFISNNKTVEYNLKRVLL